MILIQVGEFGDSQDWGLVILKLIEYKNNWSYQKCFKIILILRHNLMLIGLVEIQIKDDQKIKNHKLDFFVCSIDF